MKGSFFIVYTSNHIARPCTIIDHMNDKNLQRAEYILFYQYQKLCKGLQQEINRKHRNNV
jgi:hypothetical protein